MDNFNESQKNAIKKIAYVFGTSFENIANGFIKLGLSAKENRKSTEELIEIMKLANNELKCRKVEISRTNPNTRQYNKRKF